VPAVDLAPLAQRLSERAPGRSEATLQADIRLLLLTADFNLGETDLRDVPLEAPVGGGRRIDIEAGFTVIEVKRDLRAGSVREEAVVQVGDYVAGRTAATGQRYVGVLTDGVEWALFHLTPAGELAEVSTFSLAPGGANVAELIVWLEGVLATRGDIAPTPLEIERRLGASSSAHQLDVAELASLYAAHGELPTVQLKRGLWARLLTTAQGTSFADTEELFVEHTLLVIVAEIVAHAVVGFGDQVRTLTPATLLSGALFEQAQIGGVVEEDFFDWVLEVPEGDAFVRSLARRLAVFSWDDVEHDVMKVLYESVIAAAERHSLGEYYTPDWLAEEMVRASIDEPLDKRVLDPACGSGTFLFHAARHYLTAAEQAGLSNAEAIQGVTAHVLGLDVHPVAVTLARVTYLLAIGRERIQSEDRPPFSVPVYLGDSLQWGQQHNVLSAGALTVSTEDGLQLFANELRFPEGLVEDAAKFDQLVTELARRSADRTAGSPPPSLAATFRRLAVGPDDQAIVTQTFQVMCELHDQGRDHIWGYYVRNLVRPVWLADEPHRVDRLIGNPPWLAYQFMTTAMQKAYRAMSEERGLWSGGQQSAPHQDLSDLFVARCIELYLNYSGRFAFVMPLAALSRRQFVGFRSASYTARAHPVSVSFDEPWSLEGVKPDPFPVPSAVVFGELTGMAAPMPLTAVSWLGRLPLRNVSAAVAAERLTRDRVDVAVAGDEHASLYHARFSQGATVVPRALLTVEELPPGPLGVGVGRRAVRSLRSRQEKEPWKSVPTLEGVVEAQFIRPLHLGATVLPFRVRQPLLAVIPWDGQRVLHGGDDRLAGYPGLADWWLRAEGVWNAHRVSATMSLVDRLNFQHDLSDQFPIAPQRVVYSKAGNRLAAARVADGVSVIDHKLYWASAGSEAEAYYLAAILNSAVLTERVQPLQARGAFGPRDFDKYVFYVPIPLFDASDPLHVQIAELGARAEELAAAADVAESLGFQRARAVVRAFLEHEGVAAAIEATVSALIPTP
jgi:methylase of polypeptide subunit release factors